MQMVENNYYCSRAMDNPHFMNCNTSKEWLQPIPRSNWRSVNGVVRKPKSVKRWTRSHRNPNYGNENEMNNVTGAWNVQKKVKNRNELLWSKSLRVEKKFDGCGKFKRHGQENASLKTHSVKKPRARAIDSVTTPDNWNELVKEWGIDLHGSMTGLIRLRSPSNECVDIGDGGPSCSSDKEDHTQLESKLIQNLSRYELILPNSVTGLCFDKYLKTVGEGKCHRTTQLEDENLMLKQRLVVMGKDMDDLKRRMELVEKQFRVNENGSGDDAESFKGANDKVESDNDSGETLRKVIPDISNAILASHINYTDGIELDKSHDKQVGKSAQ